MECFGTNKSHVHTSLSIRVACGWLFRVNMSSFHAQHQRLCLPRSTCTSTRRHFWDTDFCVSTGNRGLRIHHERHHLVTLLLAFYALHVFFIAAVKLSSFSTFRVVLLLNTVLPSLYSFTACQLSEFQHGACRASLYYGCWGFHAHVAWVRCTRVACCP